MNRIAAVFFWELRQALYNRFLQVFALACVMGGTALWAASPGREMLPLVLIQALLFFGSLFAFLTGWGSGQQARTQGAFLFAQPLSPAELVGGKLLGAMVSCAVVLLLFMGPAALRGGMVGTLLGLGGLGFGWLLVCAMAGLCIGVLAAPVPGLMGVLLAWAVTVAGWELGLLALSELEWMQRSPGVFVTLLLLNPAGAFRLGAMIGLEAVPFDAVELETGRGIFENIVWAAGCVFALWSAALFTVTAWGAGRQER